MTPAFIKNIKRVFGEEVGLHYPGPLPVRVVSISVDSTTRRVLNSCVVVQGFSIDPKTDKPAGPYEVDPVTIPVELVRGKWLVAGFRPATHVNCKDVTVSARLW